MSSRCETRRLVSQPDSVRRWALLHQQLGIDAIFTVQDTGTVRDAHDFEQADVYLRHQVGVIYPTLQGVQI